MYRRLQSTRPYTSRLSITACPSLRPRIGQLWSYLHNDKSKRCKVVVSKSGCIYHNLALEDWLYEHTGADIEQRTLLMWRSDPCVVIGKFQNQWQECNYHALRKHSVKLDVLRANVLARRKSGGGAVYHDRGNINLSFITHRDKYDRRENLEFICESLEQTWPHLNLRVTDRDDILLNNKYKISGTAAKLSRDKAYHHCTLLVNSNKELLKSCLNSQIKDQITSNASASVPAPTSCISHADMPITPEDVVQCFADSFLHKYSSYSDNDKVQCLETEDLKDDKYPGIEDIQYELSSYEWIYNRTPTFTLTHRTRTDETFTVTVERGRIVSIVVGDEGVGDEEVGGALLGLPFCPVTVPSIIKHNKLTLQADNPYSHDIMDLFNKIKLGT